MTTDRAQRIYPNTARVFAAVIHHDATSRDLAAELHLSVSAVDRIIEFWRSCGLIYIGARKRGAQGPAAPVWRAGNGDDAPELEPIPHAEKSREWRERGGDSHRSRKLRKQARQIAASMTIAGQLGAVKTARSAP